MSIDINLVLRHKGRSARNKEEPFKYMDGDNCYWQLGGC